MSFTSFGIHLVQRNAVVGGTSRAELLSAIVDTHAAPHCARGSHSPYTSMDVQPAGAGYLPKIPQTKCLLSFAAPILATLHCYYIGTYCTNSSAIERLISFKRRSYRGRRNPWSVMANRIFLISECHPNSTLYPSWFPPLTILSILLWKAWRTRGNCWSESLEKRLRKSELEKFLLNVLSHDPVATVHLPPGLSVVTSVRRTCLTVLKHLKAP